MEVLLAPLLLGFSFSNMWVCALLVYSLQTTNRATCAGYLVGRAVTITALSVVVALIGRVVEPGPGPLNVVAGITLLVFATYLTATQLFSYVPPWRRVRTARAEPCDGQCSACPTHGHPHFAEACVDCADDHRLCSAEEPELAELTGRARQLRGRTVSTSQATGFLAGVTLGALRGAALCSKLTVLVPLLLGVSLGQALVVGLTFSLSSSVYPLAGFALGSVALKLVRYKRWLFATSCLSLGGLGLYYWLRGIAYLWH
jgi:hypothetical protein